LFQDGKVNAMEVFHAKCLLEPGRSSQMNTIGLRSEEKPFESRVPLVPKHIADLASKHNIRFVVEPSNQRSYLAHDFTEVGAEVYPLKGSGVPVVLGIKEMPIDFFEKGKVYIFFSHTIKGQEDNMDMLQQILDAGATLIDYERVIDEKGRRLIFFGNWAGMAGISNTFRVLGERLESKGITPNPFAGLKSNLECKGLSELKEQFQALGERITEMGLPEIMTPFVVGFAGYGNVSRGAQEMFDILPHEQVEPDQLSKIPSPKSNLLYKCVFKEEHMVKPKEQGVEFDLQDYYKHGGEKYQGVFHEYVPYMPVILNCIYWTEKYPRLITRDFIKNHWKDKNRRLEVVGDISCDVDGAIEFTVRTTNPGSPAFTYLVEENQAKLGVEGDGPVVMAVDNLPAELPRESSTSFSETLLGYIPALAKADFTVPFEKLELPKELKDAVIVYQGSLTKDYEYLNEHLSEEN
jgi:alpha-aminoadipic semialdehyde synthase